jgi:glycerate 2-kinase
MRGYDAAGAALRYQPLVPRDDDLLHFRHDAPALQPRQDAFPLASGNDGNITVLIAASGPRQALHARQVTAAIEEGVRAAMPSARVLKLPDVDAKEGFVEEIVRASGGTMARVVLPGARGDGTTARMGLLGAADDFTAIIGIDEAKDLPAECCETPDPTRASSRDAGHMILAALDHGVRRIIIGCGESGANDGGIGMASVLGIRFLDASRSEIAEAGGLLRLASIDMSRRDPRLDDVTIEAIVNPTNDLLGSRGVTRVHAPRLADSPSQLLRLESGLARYAEVVRNTLGIDVTGIAGGGAAGGLGAGLVAFLGARLMSRLDFLQICPGLGDILGAADLVITVDNHLTARGSMADAQFLNEAGSAGPFNRVSDWVEREAQAKGLPVIALPDQHCADLDAVTGPAALPSVRAALISGEQATRHARARLREASTAALRRVLSGWNGAAKQA